MMDLGAFGGGAFDALHWGGRLIGALIGDMLFVIGR